MHIFLGFLFNLTLVPPLNSHITVSSHIEVLWNSCLVFQDLCQLGLEFKYEINAESCYETYLATTLA